MRYVGISHLFNSNRGSISQEQLTAADCTCGLLAQLAMQLKRAGEL